MELQRTTLSNLIRLWHKAIAKLQTKGLRKPDNREYTLMIVPHQGESVIRLRLPIRFVKASIVVGCVLTVAATGFLINYRHTVNSADAEKTELLRLREVTGYQYAQLEQLAKKTASLQEDVGRLNLLDVEIRRMVDSEATPVSRSGGRSVRYSGQGGAVTEPNVDQLNSLVADLESTVKIREKSLADLKQRVSQHNARQAVTPSIWPTNGDVTSRFGWRSSPFGWGSDWHPGIDIANDSGTAIMATANGQVIMSGWYGGYGKCVQIDHGNGIVSLYGHNSQNVVAEGSMVKKGEVIAYMGSTGASTGSHVHYEIRVNGTAVNPANFL